MPRVSRKQRQSGVDFAAGWASGCRASCVTAARHAATVGIDPARGPRTGGEA
ncbi:MAG: hypothetical protein M0Q87_11945 [Ottowia sp.]|nr:hypothetical protein [Ottowia sp.]